MAVNPNTQPTTTTPFSPSSPDYVNERPSGFSASSPDFSMDWAGTGHDHSSTSLDGHAPNIGSDRAPRDPRLRNQTSRTKSSYDVAEVDGDEHDKPNHALNHLFSNFFDAVDTHYSHADAEQTARIDTALEQLEELKDDIAGFFDAMMQRISDTAAQIQGANMVKKKKKKKAKSGPDGGNRGGRSRHRNRRGAQNAPIMPPARRTPLAEADVNVVQRWGDDDDEDVV